LIASDQLTKKHGERIFKCGFTFYLILQSKSKTCAPSFSSVKQKEAEGMCSDDFRTLIIRLIESFSLDPETAVQLLKQILEILQEECGEEEGNER